MRYIPVESMVSQSFRASFSTLSRWPHQVSISGMNGSAVQLAVLVERRQDLSLAAHLDDLADAQVERLSHGHLLGLHCYTPV